MLLMEGLTGAACNPIELPRKPERANTLQDMDRGWWQCGTHGCWGGGELRVKEITPGKAKQPVALGGTGYP